MDDNYSPYWGLSIGIMLIVLGVFYIINGGGYAGGPFGTAPVVDFAGWVLLPCGIVITVLAIISLRRGEGKPRKYTDEDAARAKETLDRMYLREHGTLPEEPPSRKDV
jgi:hypothetical protein